MKSPVSLRSLPERAVSLTTSFSRVGTLTDDPSQTSLDRGGILVQVIAI